MHVIKSAPFLCGFYIPCFVVPFWHLQVLLSWSLVYSLCRVTVAMAAPPRKDHPLSSPFSTVPLWKQPCSDEHLFHLSKHIADWREIAPHFCLTEIEEENIIGFSPLSVPRQRISMLKTWKTKLGKEATYERLRDVFRQCHRQNLVDEVNRLLAGTSKLLTGELAL